MLSPFSLRLCRLARLSVDTHGQHEHERNNHVRVLVMMVVVLVASASKAIAQTNEIQVYDAEIEELGKFNVMVHSNFAPIGRTTPAFPGGIIPNHSVNGAVEWAYGVT